MRDLTQQVEQLQQALSEEKEKQQQERQQHSVWQAIAWNRG
jgi:hypothetical protein